MFSWGVFRILGGCSKFSWWVFRDFPGCSGVPENTACQPTRRILFLFFIVKQPLTVYV